MPIVKDKISRLRYDRNQRKANYVMRYLYHWKTITRRMHKNIQRKTLLDAAGREQY